jgi:hypothetical protein
VFCSAILFTLATIISTPLLFFLPCKDSFLTAVPSSFLHFVYSVFHSFPLIPYPFILFVIPIICLHCVLMHNHCRLLPAIIWVVVIVQAVLQMAEHPQGEDWIGEGTDSES